ncbi:MAG TPA: DegT/DnrJ/EryC1/StrS family aminotransferase [bacterium]|nr:DegT/DnrJ/EryC1/StrS family aminotransferase [bacterium]
MIAHSQPTIEPDDLTGVTRVLLSRHLAQGQEVRAFEEEVADRLALRGGIATSSGTAAMHLALLALGVGPGGEVLIPSYTCVAVLHAVHLVGATPRIVDCEPDGVNLWVEAAARQVSPTAQAIILPHMFGTVASVPAFRRLRIPVIENCAHALGASYGSIPAGSLGDVTVLSFYATKMITTGEGGMLLSRSPSLLAEARDLRDYDNRAAYRLRFNYKMTDDHAALGRSQLRKLSRFVDRRRALARIYHAELGEAVPAYTELRDGDAFYRYVVSAPDPEEFIRAMARRGVECKRPVYRPIHDLVPAEACPNASRVFQHAVSLPIYPGLSDDDARAIGTLAGQVIAEQRSRLAGPRPAPGAPPLGQPV